MERDQCKGKGWKGVMGSAMGWGQGRNGECKGGMGVQGRDGSAREGWECKGVDVRDGECKGVGARDGCRLQR